MENKLLSGVRVLDLSRLFPGPLCTLHLADMGADVIKIEDTRGGDYARWIPPLKRTYSELFLAINRNKRSVRLDYTQEAGKTILLSLVKTADVLIESFRPGLMASWGLDYQTLSNINPRLIYCSISGYGQTGSLAQRPGHDLNFISYAGILAQNGISAENPPAIPNYQLGDIVGGSLMGVMGVLAALLHQRSTGKGQYVDVSMLDGVLAHAAILLSTYQMLGHLLPRGGDLLSGMMPFYRLYKTQDDRYIALAALEHKFWKRFCTCIEKPELIDKHYVFGEEAQTVVSIVQQIMLQKTLSEWTPILEQADCCASPVLDLPETLNHPQIAARNMFIQSEHPTEGTISQFRLPIHFSNMPFEISRNTPHYGEHTQEILQELGYQEDEIKLFSEQGII
ncbi:MAG: CoA transferase [Bacteroidia bacterium]|nr:CoA transferase [Bacteroidia bacterium]